VHIKANMLYDTRDVGVGQRQVLEGLCEGPKLSWISNRRPASGRDLGLRIHASVLKDVESELALSDEDSIYLMLYGDPQKVVKRDEVLHGKFLLEGRCGVLQKRRARCSERNVINIEQQVYRIDATAEDEQGGVRLGLNKSQSEEVRGKLAEPSLGHLL
jgi:hypothetical protein